MNKVCVIMVTYNGMKWIEESIQSVLNSTLKVTVIVVDNNSSDATATFIKESFKGEDVCLIESKENLGFGKGNNLGIAQGLKKGAEYFFLLNQDAFVEIDTIEKLVEVANNNPEYGIISPIHLNVERTSLESYFAIFVDFKTTPYFYADFILKKRRNELYETKFVNAAAWLIPRKTIKEIGGFDPIFWHYGEDDNYCQRVVYHHYKIGVVPEAFIRHDSNVRTTPPDYLFSDKFYKDYTKVLKVKYANINVPLDEKAVSYEKKKIVKEFIENCLNFKFHPIKNYWRQFQLIDEAFVGINISRKINEKKAPHYL